MSEDSEKTLKDLKESKFYALTQRCSLFQDLTPDLPTQMMVETDIETNFPRVEEDQDHTRILINYGNLRGKTILYKLLDEERLARSFDIDDFMNGFVQAVGVKDTEQDELQIITPVLLALNQSALTILGFDASGTSQKTKILSEIVLKSLIAIVFNDALDVIIAMNEMPLKEGQTETESMIVGLWIVKQRSSVKEAEIV